ncbi:type III toxin-antitoxin system ToxN/AbiQ family toxin [Vibrio campbellii]|uniref:type III toxin-antitoxin system ToxN/AbiQ family toxin n=1 Tax=Vibrio campbellii TaxID=680 RepID=UPI001BD9FF0F|nr:hypothetical protein [Vibrio campbellii]MBT0138843.1 hypothetical protein [Vibrio campbellii]MBT0143521.1 hypothetical protein [Vibrio campbellii]MBT0148200.1 hypothetical protein [Vibrio campbellii]MBT0152894.1 hypothetical protein [Vibrio campbellii]
MDSSCHNAKASINLLQLILSASNAALLRLLPSTMTFAFDNYSGIRVYIVIVLQIDEVQYLTPLTSHKAKQDKLKGGLSTIYKLHQDGNGYNKLGMIQLNSMNPVIDCVISELDVDPQGDPHKSMLQCQIKFIKKNSDKILIVLETLQVGSRK